jgi:flagellar P-ring protein precursor FlgI
MLERLGVKIDLSANATSGLKTKNTAVVMVTATLPPFSRHGTRIDVTVSAMADAKSLLGGVLLPTPLMGADGETYALAQGPVAVGGYTFGGLNQKQQMQTVTKGVPTNGRVPNGGIVEKETPFELAQQGSLRIMLRNPDFTTAKRVSDAINKHEKHSLAKAIDPSTIVLDIKGQKSNLVSFITQIEQLTVTPDQQARIIFDDRDGVVVITDNVRIAPVAVAHGSLIVKITEEEQAVPSVVTGGTPGYWGAPYVPPQIINNNTQNSSLPSTTNRTDTPTQTSPSLGNGTFYGTRQWGSSLSGVKSTKTHQTSINVEENNNQKLGILAPGATLQDLVNAINALGCNPRDLITILQAIKQSGALQAQLETM